MGKIRVLVVDDSALMRKIISDIVESSKELEVAGTAVNGIDALEKLKKLEVDVVTLDFQMTEMDGLTALKHIMAENPKPVIMISAFTKEGVEETIKSMEAGAADFVTKPDGTISLNLPVTSRDEIVAKIIAASKANIDNLRKGILDQLPEMERAAKEHAEKEKKKIKVLVVDDSALMRKVISQILNSSDKIEVIGTASNGVEALKKLRNWQIDLVTLDLHMPEMDGLTTLKHIMAEDPKPVVMISAFTKAGVEETIKCLEAGAADFVTKPGGEISRDLKSTSSEEIISKIIAASKVNVKLLRKVTDKPIEEPEAKPEPPEKEKPKPEPTPEPQQEPEHEPKLDREKDVKRRGKIIVIGSSTGGPQTLERLVPKLPADLDAPVLLVQHMPPAFTKSLAERLDRLSALRVKEAEEGDIIEKGKVYIAPGDYHMEIKRGLNAGENVDKITLSQKPKEEGVRPSVNYTLRSAAEFYREKVVAVILTGMGSDGTEGMKPVKAYKGVCIAQDKDTAIIYGMPKSIADAGLADYILPLDQIPGKIVECANSQDY